VSFVRVTPLTLHQVFVGGLVFGNATADEATALVDLIVSRCAGASLEPELRNLGRLVQLPYGTEIRYTAACLIALGSTPYACTAAGADSDTFVDDMLLRTGTLCLLPTPTTKTPASRWFSR
jgi:hypothetical protein